MNKNPNWNHNNNNIFYQPTYGIIKYDDRIQKKEDVLSFGDLAILRGMRRIYHKKEITPAFFKKIRKRLSPHLSAASFYFWRASIEKENIPFKSDL